MAFFLQQKHIRNRVEEQLRTLSCAEGQHQAHEYFGEGRKISNPSTCHGNNDVKAKSDERSSQIVNGQDFLTKLEGIVVSQQSNGQIYYQVDWESPEDIQNPRNWSVSYRLGTLVLLDLIAAVVTATSAIDSAVAAQAARELNVSRTIEAFGGTGSFLVGLGLGALLAGPASELFGRYLVYLAALNLSGIWLIGAALAPDIGAQITFRFLVGFCASAPLTVAGGSMSDLWNPREMTWAFPVFAVVGFGGPVVAPLIASYIGQSRALSWRWAEWLMLISTGSTILIILLTMKETLGAKILQYKAIHLRKVTGESRFMTAQEAGRVDRPLLQGLLVDNFTRPFVLATEPIVFLFTIYTAIVYTILFTFLVGYTEIFKDTYDISQGLNNVCFAGLLLGVILLGLVVPLVWRITERQLRVDDDDGTGKAVRQELRLIFAMIGGPVIPIGLLWMGWTDFADIPIWSALGASVLIGFGTVCVFTSAYTYIIDSYQVYAASALTFVTLIRYVAAGLMTVAGVQLYTALGKHWTLTLLGAIGLFVAPLPLILFKWGPKIRERSTHTER